MEEYIDALKRDVEEKRKIFRNSISLKEKQSKKIKELKHDIEESIENEKYYKDNCDHFKHLKNLEYRKIKKLNKELIVEEETLQKCDKDYNNTLQDYRSAQKELKQALTKKVLNSIYSVDKNNSITHYLAPTTPTTPIMDEFERSNKEFLILNGYYRYTKSKYYDFKFVVTKNKYDINCSELQPTMTELKKWEGAERLRDIHKCLNEIFSSSDNYESGQKIPFSQPCRLGGQTYSNQTGYGNIYHWDQLVYEGTKYGEVTDFLIIGIIIS